MTKEGTYEKAPRKSITIKVDSNTVHEVEEETGKYIVVVEVKNDEAVGSLTIQKTGEVLIGAEKITDQMLTKLKNGLAKVVNKVSNLFTGEDAMERKKDMSLRMKNRGLLGQNFLSMQEKPFIRQMGRWTVRATGSYVLKKMHWLEQL